MDPVVPLLAFVLVKVAIGSAIVWLGLRGGPRREDEGFGGPEPEAPTPPLDPAPRRRPQRGRRERVASARGVPARRPRSRVRA